MMTPLTNKRHFAVSLLLSLLLLTTIGFGQSAAPATGSHSVLVQTGVRVKMRDGVRSPPTLPPQGRGQIPGAAHRTPYNRRDAATGTFLASRGYVAVLQDTRGRFDRQASSIRSNTRPRTATTRSNGPRA